MVLFSEMRETWRHNGLGGVLIYMCRDAVLVCFPRRKSWSKDGSVTRIFGRRSQEMLVWERGGEAGKGRQPMQGSRSGTLFSWRTLGSA